MAPCLDVSCSITWLSNFSSLCVYVWVCVGKFCSKKVWNKKIRGKWTPSETREEGGREGHKMNSNPSFWFSGMVDPPFPCSSATFDAFLINPESLQVSLYLRLSFLTQFCSLSSSIWDYYNPLPFPVSNLICTIPTLH